MIEESRYRVCDVSESASPFFFLTLLCLDPTSKDAILTYYPRCRGQLMLVAGIERHSHE